MIIMIDPGHGGTDAGAVGPSGLQEKEVVWAVGGLLVQLLQNAGITARLTRDSDRHMALADRTALANNLPADLLVSIHCNAYVDPAAGGIEIWHSLRGDYGDLFYPEAKRIAAVMLKQLVADTGWRDRGLKTRLIDNRDSPLFGRDYFAIIRQANCPALIIELGFISNPAEEKLLGSQPFQVKAARSLFQGLRTALAFKPAQPDPIMPGSVDLEETVINFKGTRLHGFIVTGRSYVELRKLAELLGATVHWDGATNSIELKL